MEDQCPVVRGYLLGVRSVVDFDQLINESYLDQLHELDGLSEYGNDTRARQHMRAFLCVEFMVSNLAHNVPVGSATTAPPPTWRRSREGLSKLIDTLNEDTDEMLAAIMEYSFEIGMGAVGKGVDQILHANQQLLVEVYKLARESAVILRQSLKNPEVSLMRVGRRLALAAHCARCGVPDMFIMARELLDQNEHRALRAWELHKR